MEPESVLRDELGDLRRHLLNEATSPSEKALLLLTLEVAELRRTLESFLAERSS
jgi:hypothetical protein